MARKFITLIDKSQPELGITCSDKLCIEIAGLIHDLGHGILSHLFDGKFLPKVGVTNFVHEHASLAIFDILIEENNLMPYFHKYGLNEDDIHFIKELILGDEHEAPNDFIWKGRGEKTFLYDIVANKRNGIDVDKFDYFARDSHVLGIAKSFDCYRLMTFARVFRVPSETGDDQYQICYHLKEAWNLCELFHTRYTLHKRAYQHKVSGAIELMIVEALILADPFIFVEGKDGLKRMSEATSDFHAYWKYSEYILKQIEHSYDPNLKSSRDMILRIRKRDLFSLSGELLLSPESKKDLKDYDTVIQELIAIKKSHIDIDSRVDDKDIFCTIAKLGYGAGGKDPVTKMTTFYKPIKNNDNDDSINSFIPNDNDDSNSNSNSEEVQIGVLPPDSVSRLIPREFEEIIVRVFARNKEQNKDVKVLFNEWSKKFLMNPVVLTPTRSKKH